MPQWRKLHVKATESLDINDMPDDFTRLLWVMLPLGLDSEGRGLDNPAWVKAKVMPLRMDVTPQMIEEAMQWFARRGMAERYEVRGRKYFWVPSFAKYQGNTSREADSEYPAPPGNIQANIESKSSEGHEQVTSESSIDVDSDTESDAEGDSDRARDYVDDLLAGKGNAGVASPTEDGDRWIEYRDKALSSYHKLSKLKPNEVAKGAIGNLAGEPDFDLQKWRDSIQSCLLNGVKAGNVSCMIDTYRAGGNYQDLYARKNGAGEQSPIVVEDGKRVKVVK